MLPYSLIQMNEISKLNKTFKVSNKLKGKPKVYMDLI